jgi:hypothetical protein
MEKGQGTMNTTLDWIRYALAGAAITFALFALACWKVSAATGWMHDECRMQNAECRMTAEVAR